MNGEDSTHGTSADNGKNSGEKNSSEQSKGSGSTGDGDMEKETNEISPTKQGVSSGGSGGDDKEPPPKQNQNHMKEVQGNSDDENSREADESGNFETDDEAIALEEGKTSEQGMLDIQKPANGENKEVKPTLSGVREVEAQVPKPRKKGFRGRRGHRGRRRPNTAVVSRPVIKRPSKPRIPKVYKPTEMIRRKRKVKVDHFDFDGKLTMTQKVTLQKVHVKEEVTSWDKEVAATLQNVIKNSNRAKNYKAIGKPRKKSLGGDESGIKKVKPGVMAYPIIEIKKKSENDWDGEAKYTIPGFCCNDCGAVYQSTAALRRHQNYECGKEPQFKCNECDYAAKHKGTLKSHIKNRHLPKGVGVDDTPKKPRKPRRPRISFIPPPSPSSSFDITP